MRIGLAQINTTVGDFDGNIDKILEVASEAASLGVDLLAYPELAVCGYPPEDLLFMPSFIDMNRSYKTRTDHSDSYSLFHDSPLTGGNYAVTASMTDRSHCTPYRDRFKLFFDPYLYRESQPCAGPVYIAAYRYYIREI